MSQGFCFFPDGNSGQYSTQTAGYAYAMDVRGFVNATPWNNP